MIQWPEVTRETPMKKIQLIHQCIWDYIIAYGKKPETPYNGDVSVVCDLTFWCSYCPIIWPDGITCDMEGSLFEKWWKTKDPEIAQQIRDLPFKDS